MLESALLLSLRRVRDDCHEWTAADVFRALFSGDDDDSWLELDDGTRVPLVNGLPEFSWPAYPRVPWAEFVCPVAASLLASCYEDWLTAALAAVCAVMRAAESVCASAQAAAVADLAEPQAGASDDAHARHAAAVAAAEFYTAASPLMLALDVAAQTPAPMTAQLATKASIRLKRLLECISHFANTSNADAPPTIDGVDE